MARHLGTQFVLERYTQSVACPLVGAPLTNFVLARHDAAGNLIRAEFEREDLKNFCFKPRLSASVAIKGREGIVTIASVFRVEPRVRNSDEFFFRGIRLITRPIRGAYFLAGSPLIGRN